MSVKIEFGSEFCEASQESSFMNATLQGAGDDVVFSVATFVSVPAEIARQGVQAVAGYLMDELNYITAKSKAFSFQVQVGPAWD